MHKKKNGSYYTPQFLSDFITRYVATYFNVNDYLSVLEPSVGDGRFVRSFNRTAFPNTIRNYSFTAIEKILPELRKAQNASLEGRKHSTKYSFTKTDFLSFQETTKRKFSLILGNPPYIKKSLLTKKQIDYCKSIHSSAGLADKTIKNIWSAFLIRSTQLLNDDGVLAFVLPAELLQVKFSSELRTYLIEQFQRIEIFTFDDLLFESAGQDTIVLIAYKQHLNAGQYYTHISDTQQLVTNNFRLNQNAALSHNDTKWTHHFIAADDLDFLYNVARKLQKIDSYCESKPGIVTAANNFFIVNQETEQQYDLSKYAHPIIERGLFVNGNVIFNQDDFAALLGNGKPSKLLCFNDNDNFANLPKSVRKYLEIGSDTGLPERYKCKKRKKWFVVPNISSVPEGFFLRRSHLYPKILKNDAGVYITDTGYKIKMREHYELNHLIYSFYNSLTLTFTELIGRYYGGGVLELTPQEFKIIPVPNIGITEGDFNKYAEDFENKKTIDDILKGNDFFILNTSLGLAADEIKRIQEIYSVVVAKRMRHRDSHSGV